LISSTGATGSYLEGGEFVVFRQEGFEVDFKYGPHNFSSSVVTGNAENEIMFSNFKDHDDDGQNDMVVFRNMNILLNGTIEVQRFEILTKENIFGTRWVKYTETYTLVDSP
jgi:hypothetical protein